MERESFLPVWAWSLGIMFALSLATGELSVQQMYYLAVVRMQHTSAQSYERCTT